MSLAGDEIETPSEVLTDDERDPLGAAEFEGPDRSELASEAPVSEFPADDEYVDQVRSFILACLRQKHFNLAYEPTSYASLSLRICGFFYTRVDWVEWGSGRSHCAATLWPLRCSTALLSRHYLSCMREDGGD